MRRAVSTATAALAGLALLLFAACGGDGSSDFRPGRLTDPRDVPTATPWPPGDAPEIIVIDPDAIRPIGGGATPSPIDGDGDQTPEPGEPGVCGKTYTIESGDTLFGIAQKCEVDLDDLRAANPGIDPAALRVGQTINLPAGEE